MFGISCPALFHFIRFINLRDTCNLHFNTHVTVMVKSLFLLFLNKLELKNKHNRLIVWCLAPTLPVFRLYRGRIVNVYLFKIRVVICMEICNYQSFFLNQTDFYFPPVLCLKIPPVILCLTKPFRYMGNLKSVSPNIPNT